MLSRALSLNALRARYRETRRIAIADFLAPGAARAAYAALETLSSRNLWQPMQRGSPWRRPERGRSGAARTFSYRYETFALREPGQEPAGRGAETALTRLAAFLDTPAFLRRLSYLTRHELVAGVTEVAATRYMPGDYLAAHDDDASARRAAFVLNLTPNWAASWGGQLLLLGPDWVTVVEAYTPHWNTLVLFDVPLPHAVVTVAPYVRAPRYAISGWVHGTAGRSGVKASS